MAAPKKTHCIRGHKLTSHNLVARSDGRVMCARCHAMREKLRYQKRRKEYLASLDQVSA